MLNRAIKSLDEIQPDQRIYYIEAEGGGFVLRTGLESLADEFNRLEREYELLKEVGGSQVAGARAELAQAKQDKELSDALSVENVPGKFHGVLKARLRGEIQDGASAEAAVRTFLATDEGQAYRGKHEAPPHFTTRLNVGK